MSGTKWTPGPWEITECLNYWVQSGEIRIAHCGDIDWIDQEGRLSSQDEMLANAHLIAAAPELYEALDQAAQFLSFMGDALPDVRKVSNQANAALAKARGETS